MRCDRDEEDAAEDDPGARPQALGVVEEGLRHLLLRVGFVRVESSRPREGVLEHVSGVGEAEPLDEEEEISSFS